MSSYLTGLALRIKFGNPYVKILAVKLADMSNDDGLSTPAAISFLAEAIETSETTLKKWRKRLGHPESQKPEEDSFNLITWKGGAGFGGASIYQIDVLKLESMASRNRRVATIPEKEQAGDAGGMVASRLANGQEATTSLSISHSNSLVLDLSFFEGGPTVWTEAKFMTPDRVDQYGPSYETDPVIDIYCKAFRIHPNRIDWVYRERIVARVELSPMSILLWKRVIEDYLGRFDWNAKAIDRIIDRYWRYRNGELKLSTESTRRETPANSKGTQGEGIQGRDRSGDERNNKANHKPVRNRRGVSGNIDDIRSRLGYDS